MSSYFYPNRRIITFTSKGLVKDVVVTSGDKSVTGNDATLSHAGVDGMIMMSTNAAAKITERAVGMSFDKWEAEISNDTSHAPSNIGKQRTQPSSNLTSGISSKHGLSKSSSSTNSIKKKSQSSTSTVPAKKVKNSGSTAKTPTNLKKDQKKGS